MLISGEYPGIYVEVQLFYLLFLVENLHRGATVLFAFL